MKSFRYWITAIFVMLVFVGYGEVSHAETYVCGDYEYEVLVNGKARIVGYTGEECDVLYIPDTLDEYKVTIIGEEPAPGGSINSIKWNAKEIYIPEGVVKIDSNPFTNDWTVTDIYIPSSVTAIDEMFGCKLLEYIHVDENNQKFCDVDGVMYSKSMQTLYRYPPAREADTYIIKDGVRTISRYAFYCCNNITFMTIPDGVTSLLDYAFGSCDNLNEISIPESVNTIGHNVFCGCISLSDVTISNGVKSIGSYAFYECEELAYIYIPASVTTILNGVFSGCKTLSSIDVDKDNKYFCSEDGVLFSKNMKILYQYPNNKSNIDYNIPNGVEQIYYQSFEMSSLLKTITIPASVNTIDDYAFNGCKSLEKINVEASNANYYDVDGVLIEKNVNTLKCYPEGKTLSEYIVPKGIQSLGINAFRNSKIFKLVISNSVKKMEYTSIINAGNINTIVLPASVEVIDDDSIISNSVNYIVEKDSASETYLKQKNKSYEYISNEEMINLSNSGDVLICNENFPDDIFRSVVARFDSNGDNCLSKNERAAITNINVGNSNISDLTGIDYFVKLVSLDCHNNKISNLNLIDNVLLERLFCYENSIKSLDVSDKTNISVLYCWDNEFESVDIQSLSEDKINSLMYNFEDSSERKSYEGAYRSYVAWGGNVSLDKENKKLVISNPDPSEFIENYKSYDTWEFQYSGKAIDLTNYKLYYNKNEVDEKLLLYNTDFTCEGFAPVGENSEEKWGELVYKAGIPADEGAWVLALKSEKLRGAKYIKAVIKKQDNDSEDDGEGNNTPSVEENSKEDNTSSVTQKSEGDNTLSANEKDKNAEDNTSQSSVNKEQRTVNSEKSKQPTTISAKSYKKTYGDKAFNIGAATNSDGVLKFTSSNPRVVTVSDKGRITIKGCGKADISIESPETADYEANMVTITVTVVPGKVTFKKVKSPKRSQIYFSWKKLPGVTGYQYNVSSKKSFKGAKLYSTNAAYKKLVPNYKKSRVDSSGGRFYIRIRAYVKIDKKTYYGKWSKVKAIKVK